VICHLTPHVDHIDGFRLAEDDRVVDVCDLNHILATNPGSIETHAAPTRQSTRTSSPAPGRAVRQMAAPWAYVSAGAMHAPLASGAREKHTWT